MRGFLCGVSVLLLVACNKPVFAASKSDWDQCGDVNNAEAAGTNIAACDRILDDRNETQTKHAAALANRCGLWKMKGEADRAIADCSQAIRLNPKLASAYNNRGNAWRAKGDYDRAIADYTEAIRLDPKYAVAFKNRGSAYRDKGEPERAIADYTEAIRINSKYVDAFLNRGNTYYAKKEYDRAIADYTEAIRIHPYAVGFLFYTRGNAYAAKKEYDRAITDYTEAIRIDPNDSGAFNNRGNSFREKKEFDRAVADYAEAIRSDPNNAFAFNNRAIIYHAKKQYDRAIADYTEAIRLDPNFAGALNGRCFARGAAGRELQEALSDCIKALSVVPDDANTLDSRGLVYLQLGRLEEAVADYDAALKRNPKLASSLYGRGVAKHRKGDLPGADVDISAATAMQPDIAEEFSRYGITAPTARNSADCSRADTHWKSAEEIKTLEIYQDHLTRFSNCEFATLARARIQALKKADAAVTQSSDPTMPRVFLDVNHSYLLSTQSRGPSMQLQANTQKADLVEKSAEKWKLVPAGDGFYRLTTTFRSEAMCLDIWNSEKLEAHLGSCANYSGQLWRISDAEGGVRLSTQFRGEGFCLDVWSDNLQAHLAPCANYSGQLWLLTRVSEGAAPRKAQRPQPARCSHGGSGCYRNGKHTCACE